MQYKSDKLGNYLHYNHPEAHAVDAGREQIPSVRQIGVDEADQPILENYFIQGDALYEIAGWNPAWGEPPSDQDLAEWEDPTTPPEAMPSNIGRIFADAYEAAPIALNQLKQAVWDYRVANGTNPNQATADGVALVLRFGPQLSAYKDAGGHPLAAANLYEAVSSEESVAALPWLTGPVLEIFAAVLVPS